MITGISTISLILGTAIAYLVSSYPNIRQPSRTLAGVLLLGGLALIGYTLEVVLGQPLP